MKDKHISIIYIFIALFCLGFVVQSANAQDMKIDLPPGMIIDKPISLIPDLPIFLITLPTPSVWAIQPPDIDGVVSSDEWNGASEIDLFHGVLLIKNDAEYLYLLVDMTGDTIDDALLTNAPWGDYFWLTFDVNTDKAITPSVDINYGQYPGTYNMGLTHYVQPGATTGLKNTVSRLAAGFGATPRSTTAHRVWEFAISLNEIDVDFENWLLDTTKPLIVRLGLKTYSQNPSFSDEHPANFLNDFSNLMEVSLAAARPYPNGPIFSGVGLIPATEIVDGYATTVPTYYLPVVDAPFGSNLHIFGHFPGLRTLGAQRYRVLVSEVGSTEPPTTLWEVWTTYKWDSVARKFVPERISPDSQGWYEVPNAADIYLPSLSDLLITWRTGRFANGLYKLQLEAATSVGKVVMNAKTPDNALVLAIDNSRPIMNIIEVSYGTTTPTPIGECEIVYLGAPPDGLRFTIKAWDEEHHLYNYHLVAHYGDNKNDPIISDSYSGSNVDAEGANWWSGVNSLLVPEATSAAYRPPQSCAYQFRLSGWARTINGYNRIHYAAYNKHITILYEGAGTGGTFTFPLSLSTGLNMISMPVKTTPLHTAKSLLAALGGTYIIALDDGRFVPFFPDFPGDGFPIGGGKGYIINTPSGGEYPFTGTAWGEPATEESTSPAPVRGNPQSGTWAFIVRGSIENPEQSGKYTISIRNLRTGVTAIGGIGQLYEGHYAAVWADLSYQSVVQTSDELDIRVTDASGKVILNPIIYQVKAPDIERAFADIPLNLERRIPNKSELLQNYPNPFNPETWIPYALAQDTHAIVRIYSVRGELVREFDLAHQRAGYYTDKSRSLFWDGRNEMGERITSGVYFYTITTDNYSASRRMVILK